MHFHAEVWIPSDRNIERQVSKAMSPYNEEGNEDNQGFWDWYQIGGRWKGEHVQGYEAEKDSDNQENPCKWCGGTGLREDKKCNSCGGTGVGMKWPTKWQPHSKDVIAVSDIPDTLDSYILVLPRKVFHREEYNPGHSLTDSAFQKTAYAEKTVKQVLQEERITTGYLVTVDYHA